MSIFEAVRSALFPKLCIFCHTEAVNEEDYACENCIEDVAKEQAKLCSACNSTVYKCNCRHPEGITRMLSVFWYEGQVRNYVLEMKEKNYDECFDYAAKRIVSLIGDDEYYLQVDTVTYVPRGKRKQSVTGIDPAFEIAKRVSKMLGKPLCKYLVCVGKKHDQKTLSGEERQKNIKGVFKSTDEIPYGRVLLVDDVMTTGATARECAKVLKKAGAAEVAAVFLARTRI